MRRLRYTDHMTTPIPEAKLAWFAAVLDLRSHIIVKDNKMRATPQFVLMVQSVNYAVVREMARLVGTSPEALTPRKKKDFMRRGCTEHCPEAHIHALEDEALPPTGKFTITGAAAAVVLDAVIPYMITDRGLGAVRDQIFAQMKLTGQGAGATRTAVRRLEALGWPIPDQIAKGLAEPQYGKDVLGADQPARGIVDVPLPEPVPTDQRGRQLETSPWRVGGERRAP